MSIYKAGQRVIFRESETGPAEPGVVDEVYPATESHPNAGEYRIQLDDGSGVVAWRTELEAAL